MKPDLFRIWKQQEAALGRRLTLREVSDGTGISVPTLSRWLNGHVHRFGGRTVQSLCGYFGCTMTELFTEEE